MTLADGPRPCEVPACVNPADTLYEIRGTELKVWLCDEHLRLAKIADSEDGTLSKDG